jgi:hypothetical protein
VLVAKKDFNLPKHGEIDTKNLYVSFENEKYASERKIMLITYRSSRLFSR